MDELVEISKEFPPAMTPLKRAAQMQGMKNNKELQNLLKEEEKEEQNMEERGCTANVILYIPENPVTQQAPQVYCANAGDARAVIANTGKAQGLSFDHKPTNPTERSRI